MDPVKNFGFVTVSTGYDASATSIVFRLTIKMWW